MKNILLLIIGIFFLSSISFSQTLNGNGNIIRKEIQISKIERISNVTSANLIVTQSETNKLTVELDENLMQYLEYDDGKNGVEINFNRNSIQPTKFNVYINVSDLKKLENMGSGNISSSNTIKSKSFKFEHTGSGNSDLNINATEFKSEITGSGNSKIVLDAEMCSLEHTGSGNISLSIDNSNANLKFEHTGSGNSEIITKCKNFDLSVVGSGDTKLKGNVTDLKLELTGSGDITSDNFTVDNCKIEMSGSGDVEFVCNKSADIDIMGSGDLKLSGNYKINKIETTGSGKLIR